MLSRCYIEITNACNLNCDFCPKHSREKIQMTVGEFQRITDQLQGKASFLYFHVMGEPLLHPNLCDFITIANGKGFKTVLTTNGTLLHRSMSIIDTHPHKVQISLHSHEGNARGELETYINQVIDFSLKAASQGTCVVLRLWNKGGRESENEDVMRYIESHIPRPWHCRPDGYRLCSNLYLEFDRKFQWPEAATGQDSPPSAKREYFCKALRSQIGILADGSLVPCCLDHDGDIILGNLLHQPLEEILSSPRARAMTEGFRRHIATERLCENCESALIGNSFRGKAKKP